MASLLNVPTEVFYYYARYIDLLDFGALLFTCKDVHNRLHEDLVFKKYVFDHSPFTIKNPQSKSSVRRKFIEYNAKLALRKNDADSLLFYFPTLACDSILQQLRPVSPELQLKLGRSNLLEQIDAADADQVLAFIIESFVADLASIDGEYFKPDAQMKKSAVIIEFMFLIGEQFLKPTDNINELQQRPERKITLLVLDLFKKFEDHAWVKLHDINKKRLHINQSTIQRMPHLDQKGAEPYLRTLFYFQEKHPEYKFNVNHPLGKVCISSCFVSGTAHLKRDFSNMTPVDYSVVCRDFEMLEFLVDLGGKLSQGFPHLWFASERYGQHIPNVEEKQLRLLELGTDPNLRRYFDASSFLYNFLFYLDEKIDRYEHIKKLIAHGARFTENEYGEIAANRNSKKYKHLVIAYDEIKMVVGQACPGSTQAADQIDESMVSSSKTDS